MRHKGFVVSALAVVLSACQGPGPGRNGPQTFYGGVRAGFVELDENTDPRFVHFNKSGQIGVLQVDGPNVYLNRSPVRRATPVANNAHVATGQGSGARVQFAPGRLGCRIGILELQKGYLYGESDGCIHQVESRHGAARVDGPPAIYHVSAFPDRTVITVIRGVVQVWVWPNPSRTVPVGTLQEAVLTPAAIAGPRPISRTEVRNRIDWRRKFVFGAPDLTVAQVSAPAAVQAGQSLEVQVKVANQGDAEAPGTQQAKRNGYMIDLVLSGDTRLPGGLSKVSSSFREDALLPGGRISNTKALGSSQNQSYTARVTVPKDTPAGRYCLGAVVDPGGVIQESDEKNNDRCHWIRVQPIIY